MVNNNLIKMHCTQGEFDGTLNSIGQRQDVLIKQMALFMEWSAFNKKKVARLGNHNSKSLNSLPPLLVISLNH